MADSSPEADNQAMVSVEDLQQRIGEGEFSFVFTRSGGPGGQNVNKVSTRVTLRFDFERCHGLTPGEKLAIAQKLASRVGRDGLLHVTVSRFRTQGANRAAAVERLFELLAAALERKPPRKRTRAPASAARRRLESKRARSIRKHERRGGSSNVEE